MSSGAQDTHSTSNPSATCRISMDPGGIRYKPGDRRYITLASFSLASIGCTSGRAPSFAVSTYAYACSCLYACTVSHRYTHTHTHTQTHTHTPIQERGAGDAPAAPAAAGLRQGAPRCHGRAGAQDRSVQEGSGALARAGTVWRHALKAPPRVTAIARLEYGDACPGR